MAAANGELTVAAVLVAAGDGRRLGAELPKALCVVAGRSLLEHAADRFRQHPDVDELIVVAPAQYLAQAAEHAPSARVVAGGATRQLSVAAGLAALSDDADLILVHDVARPFVPAAMMTRVIQALRDGASAVVPVLAVTDTIRRCDPASGELIETLDRSSLVAMQTPQGFARDVLLRAHAQPATDSATDDAALVEALGIPVSTVLGADEAFKITRPIDLALAEAVARDGRT